jgi:hypothetical protein
MNEDTGEYDDFYDYYEEIERRQVEDRYSKGYIEETKRSPIREDVRRKGAANDLDAFLDDVDDKGYNRGYSDGQSDAEHELAEDIRGLENTVDRLEELLRRNDPKRLAAIEAENETMRKLRDEAVDEKKRIFAEVSYFLGTLLDTSETPTDDVEAWAYQDGNNQAIMKVQEWVVKMNEAKDALEGEDVPSISGLPQKKYGSLGYSSDGDLDEDDDDWPPF